MSSRKQAPSETPSTDEPAEELIGDAPRTCVTEGDCFVTFTEWASEADDQAYADL